MGRKDRRWRPETGARVSMLGKQQSKTMGKGGTTTEGGGKVQGGEQVEELVGRATRAYGTIMNYVEQVVICLFHPLFER